MPPPPAPPSIRGVAATGKIVPPVIVNGGKKGDEAQLKKFAPPVIVKDDVK